MPDDPSHNLLPEVDREFLQEKGYAFEVAQVGGALHVIIHEFDLSAMYTPRTVDLLLILPAGYPNANLDMFRTDPVVRLTTGAAPQNADVYETYENRRWQRWSRHLAQAWRPGTDGLRSYLAAIRRELKRGI